jgi:eukaryotic-like serine/threonine-protein kinase
MQVDQTLAHYKIVRPLGAGGMGEVYLAEDTRLKRQVAIKVLPERLRSSEERLKRFRREAEAAASLKHLNIATIHSLEEIDDQILITMEHVEGHTLKDAIPEGGMELDQFFETFIPLADALAHAHAQGRIHRDLKPANIMITEDGTPKILDFGLARIIDPDAVDAYSDTALGEDDATQTMKEGVPSLTRGGQLIGTPQYMSPEQAERKDTDARTDIFSFGLVMYEALTGKRAFDGDSLESIIGRILEGAPAHVSQLRPVTPYMLDVLIRKCLVKDRDQRMQSAGEMHHDLQEVRNELGRGINLIESSRIPSETSVRGSKYTVPLLILAVALASAFLAWNIKSTPPTESRTVRFTLPNDDSFATPYDGPAISPDGSMIAYSKASRNAMVSGNVDASLWIRELDQTVSRELSSARNAQRALFSPDSRTIAYFESAQGTSGGTLRTVSVRGGATTPVFDLAENQYPRGATWGPDDRIIFGVAPDLRSTTPGLGSLYVVPAGGGTAELYLAPDSTAGEIGIMYPQFLPDGKTLIVSITRTDGTGTLVALNGTDRVELVNHAGSVLAFPVYSAPGYLIYQRGFAYREIVPDVWAVPIDVNTGKTTGRPFLVAAEHQAPSVSSNGILTYTTSAVGLTNVSLRQLVWMDRSGNITESIGTPRVSMNAPALSPDDRKIAVKARDRGNDDIWVFDAKRGSSTRLTFDLARDLYPDWSPDGTEVMFTSYRNGNPDLFRTRASGGAEVVPVVTGAAFTLESSWSKQGRHIVFGGGDSGTEVWALDLAGEGKPFRLMENSRAIREVVFSPDGRYIAYTSDESVPPHVYVRSFAADEGRWQISVTGGRSPRWNGDGTELFYRSGGPAGTRNSLMSVEVSTQGVFRAGPPKMLFVTDDIGYDVSSDGQRFVVVHPMERAERNATTIIVVQNWYKEFKDRQ